MANNTFDRTVIDPTMEQVVALLVEAAETANSGQRARTVSASGLVYERASIESLVYPALQMALATRKKDKGVVAEMMRACESNPLDLLAWSALADYLAENGDSDFLRTGLVATAKDALAAVQNVRAMLEPATPSVA